MPDIGLTAIESASLLGSPAKMRDWRFPIKAFVFIRGGRYMTQDVLTLELLADRVERLERRNRRLWLAALTIFILLLCAIVWHSLHPASLVVRGLTVTDFKGKQDLTLLPTGFIIRDENGVVKASLNTSATTSELRLWSQGDAAVEVLADSSERGLRLFDPHGDIRAELDENVLGPSLSLGATKNEDQVYLGVGSRVGGGKGEPYLHFYRAGSDRPFAGIEGSLFAGFHWPGAE
jgi:hypothetical protein